MSDEKKTASEEKFYFKDLAPISRASGIGVYEAALNYCTSKSDVFNIAITGPYGSGKSSIIKTFLDSEPNGITSLNVSLASFESKDEPSDDVIELSILQQMIYSQPPETLPYSRFRRISTPKNPIFSVISFAYLMISSLILINYHSIFLRSDNSLYESLAASVFILSTAGFFVWFINKIYRYLWSNPFKKIAFNNFEIEKDVDTASLLNKNIDEVLYFFEVTGINLVVFEDLDRFELPQIYTKLRELNLLVNSSRTETNRVQFLYALKDSTFTEKERVKFFDFIIPTVPTVGISTSGHLIDERARNLDVELDPRFVRDISDFLNDIRLINNIFNEFTVYIAELGNKQFNYNYLLALILFKNVYGDDFERLHDSEGVLYDLFYKKKPVLIKSRKSSLIEKLKVKKDALSNLQEEFLDSESELISVYVREIFQITQGNEAVVHSDEGAINLRNIKTFKDISPILKKKSLNFSVHSNAGIRDTGISFSEIENRVRKGISITERFNILGKNRDSTSRKLNSEILDIESEVLKLETYKLVDLLEKDKDNSFIDDYLESYSNVNDPKFLSSISKNPLMFKFLIMTGYLNENYKFYITIFKESSNWKQADQTFMRNLRSNEFSPFDLQIETPDEIIDRLDESDLNSPQILNFRLVDFILSAKDDNLLIRFVNCIRVNYSHPKTRQFIQLYTESGNELQSFFDSLLEGWEDYLNKFVVDRNDSNHMGMLLTEASIPVLTKNLNTSVIINFLNVELPNIYKKVEFSKPLERVFSIFLKLKLKVSSLASLRDHKNVTTFLIENRLFEINHENISYVLSYYGFSVHVVHEAPLHCIFEQGDELLAFITENIGEYIANVMLEGESLITEPDYVLIKIINNKEIDKSLRLQVINRIKSPLVKISLIDSELYNELVLSKKVFPSWHNVFVLFQSEKVSKDELVDFLNNLDVSSSLEQEVYSLGSSKEKRLKFERFICNLDDIEDEPYENLNKGLAVTWSGFPNVSEQKKLILARNRLVALNENIFSDSAASPEVLFELAEQRHSRFEKKIDVFLSYIDCNFAQRIFASDKFTDNFKSKLCRELPKNVFLESYQLATLIAKYYLLLDDDFIDCEVLLYVLKATDDESVGIKLASKLKNICGHDNLVDGLLTIAVEWSESGTMEVISMLSSPLNRISLYRKRPTIPKTPKNEELCRVLDTANLIKKYDVGKDSIKVFNKQRPD